MPHPGNSHRNRPMSAGHCSPQDDSGALTNFSVPCYKSDQMAGETMAFPTGLKDGMDNGVLRPQWPEDFFYARNQVARIAMSAV